MMSCFALHGFLSFIPYFLTTEPIAWSWKTNKYVTLVLDVFDEHLGQFRVEGNTLRRCTQRGSLLFRQRFRGHLLCVRFEAASTWSISVLYLAYGRFNFSLMVRRYLFCFGLYAQPLAGEFTSRRTSRKSARDSTMTAPIVVL